jgi:hypothetical protein
VHAHSRPWLNDHQPTLAYHTDRLAECTQCNCGEIRQMLTFHIQFIARKLITGTIIRHVSLNIIGKQHLHRDSNPGQKFGFAIYNLPAETNNFVLGFVLLSRFVSELQKPTSPGPEIRTLFRSLTFMLRYVV